MQPKKLLPVAAAAAMAPQQANGQQRFDSAFTNASSPATLFGPLKAIQIYGNPATWKSYPNIDPEIRKTIGNGGLDHTCSNCNQTGCLCPDMGAPFAAFEGLCENCRGIPGGGLRCYCSPALQASPCSYKAESLGEDARCDDQPACNNGSQPAPPFCEAAPWTDNPGLASLSHASVIYDVRTLAVLPPGRQTIAAAEPVITAPSQKAEPGKGYKNAVSAGKAAAAAAAAAGAAFVMGA